MVRHYILSITLVSAVSACGGAANCAEYAAAVEQKLAEATSAEEVFEWLEETSEEAARLIQRSGADGEACAGAIFEAMFTAGAMELEAEIDSLFSE